jgi:hypothetical protein
MKKLLFAAAFLVSGSAFAQDVGVAECDKFLTAYDACINAKAPADQKAAALDQIKQMRESFRAAASSPQTKGALGPQCTQMQAAMAPSLQAYGCKF